MPRVGVGISPGSHTQPRLRIGWSVNPRIQPCRAVPRIPPAFPRISLRLSPAFSMLLHRRKPSFQSRISAFPLEACVPVTESRRVISKWAEQGSFEDS